MVSLPVVLLRAVPMCASVRLMFASVVVLAVALLLILFAVDLLVVIFAVVLLLVWLAMLLLFRCRLMVTTVADSGLRSVLLIVESGLTGL